jgi:ATP-dependent Zn protease
MRNTISTRLSIRKRGESQGHHAAIATEERFSKFRHEMVGDLVWSLGAMAAEREFYGENTNGVGGDLHSATTRVASMVGDGGHGAPSRSTSADACRRSCSRRPRRSSWSASRGSACRS